MALLAETIARADPTGLFIQEVKTGDGGEAAVQAIVDHLHVLAPNRLYRHAVSGPVGNSERYGVVWSGSGVLGGAAPEVALWERHTDPPPFDLARPANLRGARAAWKGLVPNTQAGFDRAPGFVRFGQDSEGPGTVFCTIHHAREPASKVKAEALMLQATMAARRPAAPSPWTPRHTHTHTHTHAHAHTRTHAQTHTCPPHAHTRTHVHNTHTHTRTTRTPLFLFFNALSFGPCHRAGGGSGGGAGGAVR